MNAPVMIEDLGILYQTHNSKHVTRMGIFKCPLCGKWFKSNVYAIRCGKIKSCRCGSYKKATEKNTIHSETKTRLYIIWGSMLSRVLSKNNYAYNLYGGRGIGVCDEWKDFVQFRNWAMENGYADNLEIDRINNDGNYEPNNCRWVTRSVQCQNKRCGPNKTGYKGVYYRKQNRKYVARVKLDKKSHHIGTYETPKDAAIAYNNWIIANHTHHILNTIN